MQSFKNRMDVVRFLSFTHKALLLHSELFEVCLVSTVYDYSLTLYVVTFLLQMRTTIIKEDRKELTGVQ